MDLASFLINSLNKIEPTTETSLSVLRVGLSDHFKTQEQIMEDFENKKKHNEEVDSKIDKLSFTLGDEEYGSEVEKLSRHKVELPKVSLYTKVISLFSKPMARLLLYVLFIIVSSYITKKFLKKESDSNDDDDDDDDDFDNRPSKKERKILKKYKDYDKNLR